MKEPNNWKLTVSTGTWRSIKRWLIKRAIKREVKKHRPISFRAVYIGEKYSHNEIRCTCGMEHKGTVSELACCLWFEIVVHHQWGFNVVELQFNGRDGARTISEWGHLP